MKRRRIMRASICVAMAAAILWVAPLARAGDFDGSKRLICATVQALDCVPGEDCLRGLAADIGAPTFMRIDFQQKAVIGPQRTSPVQLMEANDEQLLLQGTELGLAWAIALNQVDGSMAATMVNRAGAFVLFGSCTPE